MSTVGALVVALTGGVAAGKSVVARGFARRGIAVYDADVAARDAVAPGSDGLAEVVATFGDVLDAAGALDRAAMRRRIFADPTARQQLEAIVHPRVRAWLKAAADDDRGPYCVLAIPLLVENLAHYRWVDRVVVVDVPESTQAARLCARDGIDEALARSMLAQQASREQRLAIADEVIDNGGSPADLDPQVQAVHERCLALAAAR